MTKKTFKFYTLGCKVNQYDSKFLKSELLAFGLIEGNKNNDLVIINTCSVTKTAIKKGKRIIGKAKKENPKAKVVVFGCWPEVYRQEIQEITIDLVWGTGKLKELSKKIIKIINLDNSNKTNKKNLLVSENRSRYFIKIQDGCEQFCSYCIIPYSRGKVTSRPQKEIMEEVVEAVAQGFQEIVLTGIHLGLYGQDRKSEDLVNLLKTLIKIKGLGRIRISSIEINEVSEELIELFSQTKKLCPHLHIPLQAGSDKILKLMNRPYVTSFFSHQVNFIKNKIPNLALSTDIIVGFPGETKKDFQETLSFVKKIKFSRIHVFPFSAHEKAPASKFRNQIDQKEINSRVVLLRSLSQKLEKEFIQSFNNSFVYPVIEKVDARKIKGRTEYYFEVNFNFSQLKKYNQGDGKNLIGKIVKIKA